MSSQLDVRHVSVAYGGSPAVRDVSFSLEQGTIGCLLGPSGCGKTTLLRAVAGFESLTGGKISFDGTEVSAPGRTLPPEQHRVGMVFQDFALFPHLSVERNIAFGLWKWPGRDRDERVSELLSLVGLEAVRGRYPHQLSGGMQQRVAVARALAPRPAMLLLDEPFSSIDAELREQLARELREMLRRERVTTILVTHDQLEAFAMADRIGVLSEGSLRQWGSGFELYHQPADRFVADFIGRGVMLPARVADERHLETELGLIGGQRAHGLSTGGSVELLIRPDDVIHDDDSSLKAEVVSRSFRGAEYLYELRLASGRTVLCLVQSHHDHRPGERIGIRLDLEHLVAFPTGP